MRDAMKTDVGEDLAAIRQEIGRTVVGYRDAVDDLLIGSIAGGHVLIEGVPGVAKTTLAKTFARVIGLSFHRIQFTQDLLPSDITGHYFFNQQTREFELRPGPIFASVVLADEINRAPPKTQSALLEAMEERQVTIEGHTIPLPKPFIVLATMNPVDSEGVYRLPEAQLDRFIVRSQMGYLQRADEKRMLVRKLAARPVDEVPGDAAGFLRAQEAARNVFMEESVLDYLHEIGLATRAHPDIALGASPRAIEKLVAVSRATALLEGRDYVIPDDTKLGAHRVLTHRLLLTAEAELGGASAASIITEIVSRVPLPRLTARA